MRRMCSLCLPSAMLFVISLIALQEAQATTEAVLYSFAGSPDGSIPTGRLTADNSGNFYGATNGGGANGHGTVFELSPQPVSGCPSGTNAGGDGWCETVLYSFCSVTGCTDGDNPAFVYVTFDELGNLYGTTSGGGANGDGTVFELSPQPMSGCPTGTDTGNGWCETVLYSFQGGDDAASPSNGLVWDSSGNLYGTSTAGGGIDDGGSVYELSPNDSGEWTEQVIYSSLCIGYAGLGIDASGNLYGVDCNADGHVFKLSFASGVWTAANIHTFTGSPKDGYDPSRSTPVVDGAGNLYGTTVDGGSKNAGTVWKLTPVTTGKDAGTYKEKILHSFTSEETGEAPYSGVTLDSSGNLYGTTYTGGKYESGTVFELTVNGTTYKHKLLWSFNVGDGWLPSDSPILDSSGNVYGTTAEGGTYNIGTVFKVTP